MIFLSSSSLVSFLFYGLAITCLTSANVSPSDGGNETDYLALLSFKSKITYDPYKVLTSWNHSFHFCDWSGVSCGKRHKRVTALRLFSKGLEGSLSPHVGNLSFLRALYLPNNSFQGTIPRELGRLSRLRRLHLGANKFSGVIPTNLSSGIPPFLGNITSMEVFSAVENPLGRSIPDTLGHWKSLTGFYSGECNLYGSIPHSIFNLSLLVNLTLADNHVTGSLPSEIGSQLPNLELLQLWGNELTGVLPPSISNCSKLRWLEIGNNSFSGKLTIDFSKLRDINRIYLSANNFHGHREADDMRFIDSLKNSTKLEALTLYNCNLMGVLPISIGLIPDSLGNLSSLTELYLYSNKLEGHIPSSLGNCTKLTVFSLADNRLSGKIPKQIIQLSSLSIGLDLSQNSLSGSIPLDIKDLKMLNILDLSYNNLSGTITSNLGECVSLTALKLQGNQFQGIIPSSISSLRGLEVLDMSQNNLSGKIPQFLDKRFSLTFLNLSFNDFEGEVRVVGAFSNTNAFSVLGNNGLCGGLVTLELPTCNEKGTKKEVFRFFVLLIFIAPFSIHKGILASDDDRFVAVKVLRLQIRGAHKSFLAKCEAWRNIRHRNLLKIVTSCSSVDFHGNDFKAIVYEFMPSGSVHDWLHSSANTSKLNLLQRINILRDVATALDYLHNCCQTTIVHGDLKPSNILLDDYMVAHVGDFGLARLLGTDLNQNNSTRVKGTIGYAPP
ncbi:kinase-like domain-containing protein, partial [Tanacetum coccineum]